MLMWRCLQVWRLQQAQDLQAHQPVNHDMQQ